MQNILLTRGPFQESNFMHYVEREKLKLPSIMFNDDFDIKKIIGPQPTVVTDYIKK